MRLYWYASNSLLLSGATLIGASCAMRPASTDRNRRTSAGASAPTTSTEAPLTDDHARPWRSISERTTGSPGALIRNVLPANGRAWGSTEDGAEQPASSRASRARLVRAGRNCEKVSRWNVKNSNELVWYFRCTRLTPSTTITTTTWVPSALYCRAPPEGLFTGAGKSPIFPPTAGSIGQFVHIGFGVDT